MSTLPESPPPRQPLRPVIAMSHTRRTLVRTGPFHIEHCGGCDVLHVSVGPVTLRLELGAARQLRAALHEALERLEGTAPVASPSPTSLHN